MQLNYVAKPEPKSFGFPNLNMYAQEPVTKTTLLSALGECNLVYFRQQDLINNFFSPILMYVKMH